MGFEWDYTWLSSYGGVMDLVTYQYAYNKERYHICRLKNTYIDTRGIYSHAKTQYKVKLSVSSGNHYYMMPILVKDTYHMNLAPEEIFDYPQEMTLYRAGHQQSKVSYRMQQIQDFIKDILSQCYPQEMTSEQMITQCREKLGNWVTSSTFENVRGGLRKEKVIIARKVGNMFYYKISTD